MHNWFHGTNQLIHEWEIDDALQGLNTQAFSAKGVIYATNCPHLASHYAYSAANKLYPHDHREHVATMEALGRKYNRELDRRLFDEADKTCALMEQYEAHLQSEASGQMVYALNLVTDNFKAVDYGGGEWGGEKAAELLAYAEEKQLDVLVVNNTYDRPTFQVGMDPISIAIIRNPSVIEVSIGESPRGIVPVKPKPIEFDYNPIVP